MNTEKNPINSMYTIGLDTSALNPEFKEHSIRGIGRYVFELNKYFSSYRSPHCSVQPFRHEDFLASKTIDNLVSKFPLGRQTIRQQLLFPLSLTSKTEGKFDLLHFPAHMDAPSWCQRKYIITVLDLIPIVCADIYKAGRPSWRYHLARWLEIRAIKNASHILAISQNTAKDVHEILGIPYERISVTPLGVAESFAHVKSGDGVRKRYGIPDGAPIVLYVGGIDQRKNIRGLVESFSIALKIAEEKQKPSPYLLLVGQITQDRQYPELQTLISKFDIRENVIETGYVDDAELGACYRSSTVFFYPSLYEGFGLPPLEAMAAGVPVVSSKTSCMPEVLGDAALLVDPTKYDECGRALAEVISNGGLAEQLREKGKKQAAQFTWERTGKATASVYEMMAKR